MANFTKEEVAKLIKATGDTLVFDDSTRGFFVRTYASGAPAQFGVKYSVGGKQRRMNLGAASPETLATMRELAEITKAKAKTGTDTLGQQQEARAKVASAATLGKLIPAYLKDRKDSLRANSYSMTERYLTKHWKPLHSRAVTEIKRADVVQVIDEIAAERGRVAADRARSQLSAMFWWIIDKPYYGVETNPCMHIKERAPNKGKNKIETKTRALSEAELVNVWNESEGATDFGRATRLLILTGCRKREIYDLVWDEVDFDKRQILLPKTRVKNGEDFVLPLSEQALEILRKCPAVEDRGGRVFGKFSWSRYKQGLDERLPADMAPWVIHDLRRSFVTLMAENGIASPHIIEACVNHISGHKAGVAGIYNRATYLKEKTETFAAWGRFVEDLVAGRRGNIVARRKGAA